MRFKGQFVTVEQLIVFAMGVFILIGVTIAYTSANKTTKTISVENQFKEVGEFILSNVIYSYNSGRNSEISTETSFNIPVELSAQAYKINLSQYDILIQSFEDNLVNVSIPIGTINESVTLTGNATSPKGRIKINYDLSTNTIVLRDI